MRKALITGGAGFIGLHLTQRLLADGWAVDILDNFARGVQDQELRSAMQQYPDTLTLRSENLLDLEADALPTDYAAIVHLAAIIGVQHVLNRPYAVLVDNVRMLDTALAIGHAQQDLQRFLVASTSEIYAGTLRSIGMDIPTPESTHLVMPPLGEARTSYMLSKAYGEAMCLQSGLPTVQFRPHNVYGPRMGMSHVIPELHKRIRETPRSGALEVASLSHMRTFCYVDDAVAQIQAMMSAPVAGESLNVGQPGPEVTIETLARALLSVLGRDDIHIEGLPETAGSPTRRCPDMSRTFEATGLGPGVSLEEGLRRTTVWYEEQVFAAGGISAV